MSLHTLAKHVQEKGRGNDQMLVHMTPKEVQGLQALAKAHGGSLTVNPETGLPEAGFLEQVLPIVAMAAATYFTAGAAAPALSAALAGEGALAAGTVTAAGGMAAGTLAGAGVGALGAAAQNKDVGKGALYGGIGGAIAGGMGAYGGPESAVGGAAEGAKEAGQTAQVTDAVNKGQQINDVARQMADPNAGLAGTGGTPAGINAPNYTPNPNVDPAEVDQMTSRTAADALQSGPTKPLPPSSYSEMGMPSKAMTLAAPGIGADIGMNTPGGIPASVAADNRSHATLSPNFQGYSPTPPDPKYRAQYTRYAAGGGLMT